MLGAFESSVEISKSGAQGNDAGSGVSGESDFGRYRVMRPLGEGGMGTVYLAEQQEPIRRRVALKVVKLGMDTAQVLARFQTERQALAVMDHPNIAQIFDAGATAKGSPYFVDGVHRRGADYGVLRWQATAGERAIGALSTGVPRRATCAPEGRNPS